MAASAPAGAGSDDVRSHLDADTAYVDRRFRTVFAFGALALVAINAAVGLIVLHEQAQMRDVGIGMYDHAFVPASYIDKANVEFQKFVDRRSSAKGLPEIQAVNQVLDPVVDALDVAAEHSVDEKAQKQRREVRSDVLSFEGDFADSGPAIWSKLRETQDQLSTLASAAIEDGLRARNLIESTSTNCQFLLIGSVVAAVLLGVVTMMVLRRSIAVSTLTRISRMANYDLLTGLPNRSLLHRRLTTALDDARQSNAQVAVLCLDLDRFKYVNDSLGHQVGDLLLVEVAERLRKISRAGDVVARFGGDEFVVMLKDVRKPADAGLFAERLVAAIGQPYEFDGQRVLVGASVGVALAPQHGKDAEELLRNSDLALYLAKTEGKGQYRFFEDALNANVQARRLMELDLREALERGEIEPFFQPVIEVASGKTIGCEALARWNRPGHGFVSPAEFIPLAEDTGLILQLGESVLRKACKAAAQWPTLARVAVNLSARQFQGGDLVALVSDALQESGLSPTRLELEITESILIGDKAHVLKVLNALRALGVRIALDDFGTGYSSLSYLSSFPFDKIKIDRSFITNIDTRPDAAAIVRAVTSLALTLGMSTTAEGVESCEDLEWLKGHGCDQAQGFLVSRPLPPAEMTAFLKAASPACENTVAFAA